MSDLRLEFSEESLMVLNFCLAFIMFSVALHLRWSSLRYVFKAPLAVIAGLLSQMLFLPLLTIGLILIVDPSPDLAAGMLLLAACPGGNVSNFFALIGRANIELSVTLTTITSLTSAFTTPLLFFAMSGAVLQDSTTSFDLPFLPTLITIGWVIVIPAILGMLVAKRFRSFADKISKPLQGVSMLVLIGFIVVALKANMSVMLAVLAAVFWLVILHNASAFFGAWTLARLFKLPKRDRLSISLETSTQNTALGMLITFNFFDGNGPMSFILAFWGVWHLISGYTFARLFRVDIQP